MGDRPRTIYLVKRLETLIRTRLESALAAFELTPGQYTTMSLVHAGPISSAETARRVGITPQSMSEVIATLERKGLVARALRSDNRRIADIVLTDEGKALLRKAEERVDDLERALLDGLDTDEKDALRGSIEKILR